MIACGDCIKINWTEEGYIVPSAPVHHGIHAVAVKKLLLESGIVGLYFTGYYTVGVGIFTERAADSGTKVAKMIIERYVKNV